MTISPPRITRRRQRLALSALLLGGFACALFVALRARGINHAGRRLLRAVVVRFVKDPLPFFLPVGRDATAPLASAQSLVNQRPSWSEVFFATQSGLPASGVCAQCL